MSSKTEHRIRKVAEAVKTAVAEGHTEAMQNFLSDACLWPFWWRLKLAKGILFKRYKKSEITFPVLPDERS